MNAERDSCTFEMLFDTLLGADLQIIKSFQPNKN